MSGDSIKIMYVIGSMGNGLAGTERNLLTIIEHLDRQGFQPHLVSLQDCEFIRSGSFPCPTECLHLYRMFTPQMFRIRQALSRRMTELKIDIVQTFFTEAHLVGGGAAVKAQVKAIISSRRNLGYSYRFKEKLFLKIANRYPHRFLANSEAVADSISRVEAIPRDRFDVIYNGVDIASDTQMKEVDYLAEKSNTIVMIANLRPVKSVETFIAAAAVIVKSHPSARFLVAGNGPEQSRLQSLINTLRLTGNVGLLGSLKETGTVLQQGSIGVLTSISEGFSNSILEYMRAGLAVVVTDVGGNREVVREGENGFLVPVRDVETLAEKLSTLLSNSDLARQLGAEGKKLVEEKFSLTTMIHGHQDYYSRLIQHT